MRSIIFRLANANDFRLDEVSSLLRQPLSASNGDKPDTKRARLSSAQPETTIEKRILNAEYESVDQVETDLKQVRNIRRKENGDIKPISYDAAADKVTQLLSAMKEPDDARPKTKHNAGQIIMLRGNTDKGVAMLYSGLQSVPERGDEPVTLDGRKLPNGFDLAKPAAMDPTILAPSKQSRKFADVFGPHRNTKALEMPRTRTSQRINTLKFSSEPFPERPTSLNRQDYRNQQVAAGSWLTYSRGHTLDEQDASRKYRDKATATNDFRAALISNDHTINESTDNISLFKQAFSSFAPTSDSSMSLVTDQDRDRQYWRKYGSKRLQKIFQSSSPDLDIKEPESAEQKQDDNFEDVLNYQPDEEEMPDAIKDDAHSSDEILEEISQLLETVHSFQKIRSLEVRASIDNTKPTNDEFDTYEMLRSQLAILVASVPPFAVAKLDGDKLSDLNISTNLVLDTVDYRGTMQPDDFTLSKYRSAQAARVPQAQPVAATPRPAYQTQSNAGGYNANLQAYAQNLGIQAQYAQRQAQQYSTPQPTQRANYQNYQQQGSYTTQPTVQQFQRQQPQQQTPSANYGAWSANNSSASSYGQMPSQPGYQQRAQRQAALQQAQALYGGQAQSPQLQQYGQRPLQPGGYSPAPQAQGVNGGGQ